MLINAISQGGAKVFYYLHIGKTLLILYNEGTFLKFDNFAVLSLYRFIISIVKCNKRTLNQKRR
jgi:hypothetical protein